MKKHSKKNKETHIERLLQNLCPADRSNNCMKSLI